MRFTVLIHEVNAVGFVLNKVKVASNDVEGVFVEGRFEVTNLRFGIGRVQTRRNVSAVNMDRGTISVFKLDTRNVAGIDRGEIDRFVFEESRVLSQNGDSRTLSRKAVPKRGNATTVKKGLGSAEGLRVKRGMSFRKYNKVHSLQKVRNLFKFSFFVDTKTIDVPSEDLEVMQRATDEPRRGGGGTKLG